MIVAAHADDGIARFVLPDQRVEQAVFEGQPLPERAAGHLEGWCDLVAQLSARGVDDLARLVIGEVQYGGCGHERVAMHHQAGRDRAAPEELAVEPVEGCEGVQPGLLPFLEGDMTKELEHPAGGGHGHLRQRRVARVGKELRQVRRSRELILRCRVVVGPVIRMAPVVHARGERLGKHPAAEEGLALRAQHAEEFGLGRTVRALAHHHDGVGEVVGEVQPMGRARFDKDAAAVKPGGIRGATGGVHLAGVR
ncbi:MAG: hypothetical protein M5U12_11650 [Verrucomicrobia bacterium]|nr:hypothetical protein [Verrucomicrobiota bacterium]